MVLVSLVFPIRGDQVTVVKYVVFRILFLIGVVGLPPRVTETLIPSYYIYVVYCALFVVVFRGVYNVLALKVKK